jgi:hypothetical protein
MCWKNCDAADLPGMMGVKVDCWRYRRDGYKSSPEPKEKYVAALTFAVVVLPIPGMVQDSSDLAVHGLAATPASLAFEQFVSTQPSCARA